MLLLKLLLVFLTVAGVNSVSGTFLSKCTDDLESNNYILDDHYLGESSIFPRKVYLQKNMHAFGDEEINVLTQAMLSRPNTIYVIMYDFVLIDDLTLPANSVLEFNGGSINGSFTLFGQNSIIKAEPDALIFSGVDIRGTWNVKDIYVSWMAIPNHNECGSPVRSICRLQSDDIQQNLYFPDYELSYTPLQDSFSTSNELYKLVILSSKTHLHLPKALCVNANDLDKYEVISAYKKNNIVIDGGGGVIGDIESHTGSTGEWGMGLALTNCHNVIIKDISISKCWGDGVYIGGYANEKDNYEHGNTNIVIENVVSIYNRRQAMSVVGATKGLEVIQCNFSYTGAISGTSPQKGIDFESNDNYSTFDNIVIRSCSFLSNQAAQISFYRGLFKNIIVDNCFLDSHNNYIGSIVFNGKGYNTFDNIQIINCTLNSYISTSGPDGDVQYDICFRDCDIKRIMTHEITSYPGRFNLHFYDCRMVIDDKEDFGVFTPIYLRNDSAYLYFSNCTIEQNNNSYFCYLYNKGYDVDVEFESCTIACKFDLRGYTKLILSRVNCPYVTLNISNTRDEYRIEENTFYSTGTNDPFFFKIEKIGNEKMTNPVILINNNKIISNHELEDLVFWGDGLRNKTYVESKMGNNLILNSNK